MLLKGYPLFATAEVQDRIPEICLTDNRVLKTRSSHKPILIILSKIEEIFVQGSSDRAV